MTVSYKFSCEGISTLEFESIFKATNLSGREGERIRRAFLQSSIVCLAFDRDKMVGVSRAITDGEYHAFIYDVAVYPEHQGKGIGKCMVEKLLERLPVWRVMLRADEDVQAFYRKIGFNVYSDVMAKIDSTFYE